MHGTPDSPGTKILSLTGKLKHQGLVEVPFGITLDEVIHGIGGGHPPRQAVQGTPDWRSGRPVHRQGRTWYQAGIQSFS
ncbi:MAG: hypothetical protein M0C28_41365 [Candidatus Moduliflexus flocculans]|nr:hypothetical protein [Candidatus Moduliflexus flocculans]